MHTPLHTIRTRGIGLIDVLVGVALVSIVFAGIIGGFRLALELISITRAQEGALSIANDQLELIRSLPYNDVGTEGGIPSGNIPQDETITLNKVEYSKRVLIQYVDAPEDGLDLNDENGITADYKRVRVEISWSDRGKDYEEVLVTNVVPPGVESNAGGGTLRINVFDASVTPIEDAEVRVVNASTSPPIDVTTYTNTEGIALFSGAPASSGYEISTTKAGYSSAQTYGSSPENPNPNPGHIAVTESQTSGISFSIDLLSTSTITTSEPVEPGTTTDTFADAGGISQSTSTDTGGGTVSLAFTAGTGYDTSGTALSTQIAPAVLDSWNEFSFNETTPGGTGISYQLYYEDTSSVRRLVPDSEIAGNSTGLTTSPVDISGLDTEIYDNLFLETALTTNSTSTTPSVDDWTVTYFVGPTPIPNVTFSLQGSKTIGTDDGGNPIYKYNEDLTTDGAGITTIGGLEWDTYTINIDDLSEGYDIAEICPPSPFSLSPGVASTTDVTLVPNTNHSLRVIVKDTDGDLLSNVDVNLTQTGYDVTQSTSPCGQTFFEGLAEADGYTLDSSLSGYTPDSQEVDISGVTTITVTLSP